MDLQLIVVLVLMLIGILVNLLVLAKTSILIMEFLYANLVIINVLNAQEIRKIAVNVQIPSTDLCSNHVIVKMEHLITELKSAKVNFSFNL